MVNNSLDLHIRETEPPLLNRQSQSASFLFGVHIRLGTIFNQFSIIYFRGLGLRVRVWVRIRFGLGLGLVWCYGQ